MKCPHCGGDSRAKVLESRQHDGKFWRRRTCSLCFRNFMTVEVADLSLRMPAETQSKYRVIDRKPKPEQGDGIIRSTGDHLKWNW